MDMDNRTPHFTEERNIEKKIGAEKQKQKTL